MLVDALPSASDTQPDGTASVTCPLEVGRIVRIDS